MKKIQLIFTMLFISFSAFSQTVNFPGTMQRTVDGSGFKFKFVGGLGTFAITDSIRAAASGGGSAGVISFNGRNGIVTPQLADYSPFYPSLSGSYSNPSWITGLAWSKIIGTPTTLSGYGITDAYPLTGNPSGFLTSSYTPPSQVQNSLTPSSTTLAPSVTAVNNAINNPYRYSTIVDKSAPEVPPSELPGTTHNAFGFLAQTKQGDIFYFYREASEHVGTAGIIRYIKSTDGGKTFGSPVTMFTESGMDLRNLGGGVTKTGRIVVFYERYNYLDPANVTIYGSAYSYSDDNGSTWSTPVNKTNFEVPYGGMIEIDGKLMQSGYGIIGSNHTDVIYSTDNGTTWGTPQVVASSGSLAYSEASYSYLGNGNILGVVRDSPSTTGFRQFLSTNNGSSWTSQGVAAVDTTESVAPWLDVTFDLEGKRLVSLYYHNRDNKTFRVVSSRAQDIISNGVTAWDLKTRTTLRTFTTETDYGYPSVIHPNNSNYSLGAYYNGIKTGVVRTNFFTYSSPIGINTKVKFADALRGYGNVLHNIGLDYNGTSDRLTLKIDALNFGSTFPIDISGTAASTPNWSGITGNFSSIGSNLTNFLALDNTSVARYYSPAQVKTSLGISDGSTLTNSITGFAGGVNWGNISGSLSAQTDLNTALNGKQANLVSGTNIATINGNNLLLGGNVNIPTPSWQQVTTAGNNSSNAIYVSGSTGSTTGKALALTYQEGLDGGALQAYDYTNTLAKTLFIQPSGGNTVIGAASSTTGAALEVVGKATVSSAPTNPTDVVNKAYADALVIGGGYVLPTASSSTLGGIKVGSGLAIDGSGVLSATGGGVGSYVDLTTDQTIAGNKTFTGASVLNNLSTNYFAIKDFSGGISVPTGGDINMVASTGRVIMASSGGTLGFVIPSTSGTVRYTSFPSAASGTVVYSVNGSTPDASGNVTVSGSSLTPGYGVSISSGLISVDTAATNGITSKSRLINSLSSKANLDLTVDTKTANYTLVMGDRGKFIQMNVASANTLTVPTNASVAFPVGTQLIVRQMGAGQTTITPASGVTIDEVDNMYKTKQQKSVVALVKVATNTWVLTGSTAL